MNSLAWQDYQIILALSISEVIFSSSRKVDANQPMEVEINPLSLDVCMDPIAENNHTNLIPNMSLQLRKMAINVDQPDESQEAFSVAEAFTQYFDSCSMLVSCFSLFKLN